jgi:hypothetical protein
MLEMRSEQPPAIPERSMAGAILVAAAVAVAVAIGMLLWAAAS